MVETCCKCEIGVFMDSGVTALVCGGDTLRVTRYIRLLGDCDLHGSRSMNPQPCSHGF